MPADCSTVTAHLLPKSNKPGRSHEQGFDWKVKTALPSLGFFCPVLKALRPVYKPHSVLPLRGWTAIYLCSRPGTQTKRAASCPCLTLLPAGVTRPYTLLRTPVVSYTTFSPSPHLLPTPKGDGLRRRLFVFCGPIRQVAPPRDFPGAALCGVRTFLDPVCTEPRPSDQPEAFSSYHISDIAFAGRPAPLTFYPRTAKMLEMILLLSACFTDLRRQL